MVPEQISVTGYDDSVYASMIRPKLTTVHQDVPQKAHVALERLMKLIQGETLNELNIKKSKREDLLKSESILDQSLIDLQEKSNPLSRLLMYIF